MLVKRTIELVIIVGATESDMRGCRFSTVVPPSVAPPLTDDAYRMLVPKGLWCLTVWTVGHI